MSGRVKLPKHLRKVVHDAFGFKGYEIMEAHVDEMAYTIKDGLGKLRDFLGISENESVCDCFCKISIHGLGEKKFLFEDKKTKHSKRFKDAKRQLENTNDLLEQKNIEIDFAVVCRTSLESPFKSRQDNDIMPPLKSVYLPMNGNSVNLDNSSSNKIPLLCT